MKKILSAILVLLMMLSLTACSGETGKTIAWDDVVLGDMLPEPPTNKGRIYTNAADDLWINIKDLSAKQFNDYVEACKEMGFTIDDKYNSSTYEAYNAEGYKLSLSYYGDMSIELDAPMKMTTITWPTSVAGNMLPTPKSTTGKFSHEYEDHFYVYIANTTRDDYAEYVAACSEKGFNVDYRKGDDYYYADNSEGWHISLHYEGNNIITIDIDAPSDKDNNKETTPPTEPSVVATTPPATEEKKDENAIDPEFKAAMDSYEEFFDEYVAIMKKYQKNPTDLSILADYTKYMGQYTDMMQKFEKWENEDLNTAELAYYMDVQARITKKLLEVV